MKKTLMGFAALTLILASCSKNEVVDNLNSEKELIKFSTISGNVSTKATETVLTDLQRGGVDVFALYTKGAGSTYSAYFTDKLTYTSSWAPGTKRYLKDGVNNEFYSIYPSQTAYATAANLILPDDAGVGFNYTVENANVDLLGAAATETYSASTDGTTGVAVTLPFHHLLSQVNLGVKLDNTPITGNGNVVVTKISFNSVGAKGTYKFGKEGKGIASNWVGDNVSPLDTFSITESINTNGKTAAPSGTVSFFLPGGGAIGNFLTDMATSSLMPMPLAFVKDHATYRTSSITFKFQAYDIEGIEITNGETDGTITLYDTEAWKQGLRYIYVLDFDEWFNNRVLKFDVTLSDWENHDWNNNKGTGTGVVKVSSF